MKQSPVWEAASLSDKEILYLVCNPNVEYCVHNSPPSQTTHVKFHNFHYYEDVWAPDLSSKLEDNSRLLIHYIRNYPPYRAAFYQQTEGASCHGDKGQT
jgi:hypothetical protein